MLKCANKKVNIKNIPLTQNIPIIILHTQKWKERDHRHLKLTCTYTRLQHTANILWRADNRLNAQIIGFMLKATPLTQNVTYNHFIYSQTE